jgi:magnesium transporter
MIYMGRSQERPPRLRMIDYSASEIQVSEPGVAECVATPNSGTVRWVHVQGVHEAELIKTIARNFSIDPMTAEDILHTRQRAKAEEFPNYLFLVLHSVHYDAAERTLESGQVSICLGPNFVLSFEESHTDFSSPVVERLRTGRGRVRGEGAAYHVYSLLDLIVDQYFFVLEDVSDAIDTLESWLLSDRSLGPVEPIYDIKRLLLELRRLIVPVQDLAMRLRKPDQSFFPAHIDPCLHDLSDHIAIVNDNLHNLQDISTELVNLYMSRSSSRINEVMRTLTVIGSIFIPLTFLAGVWGMNFRHMPELDHPYGYPIVLGAMTASAVGMVAYFKRRGWF